MKYLYYSVEFLNLHLCRKEPLIISSSYTFKLYIAICDIVQKSEISSCDTNLHAFMERNRNMLPGFIEKNCIAVKQATQDKMKVRWTTKILWHLIQDHQIELIPVRQ